jgi:lipid A 3-O-deacylase
MMRMLASLVVVSVAFAGSSPVLAQGGFIDEGKLGIIAHDINLFGTHKEPGADINGEVLFTSPGLLRAIGAPRPHLGVSVNDAGATSYAYAGLTWTLEWRDILFAGLGLGGAVHDGNLDSEASHHKALGSRALFHESLELGAYLTEKISTSLFLDHISNADLARHNAGITNFGLRAGYKF